MTKSYSELILIPTLKERFEYLKLGNGVGHDTFGYLRFLNQNFYNSRVWRNFRNRIITRDQGCEMGLSGYPIFGKIILHHINPISSDDLINLNDKILMDEENVICVSNEMHQAIHYGVLNSIQNYDYVERHPNDTCPWRK
jgi:hypothetical protein